MMAKPKASKVSSITVPIARAALMARINRKLAQQNEQLMASRSARSIGSVGEFYVVRYGQGGNEASTNIIDTHVNPVELARELGVLKQYEKPEGL